MNGAAALVSAAVAAGVEVCFANPGTTELPLVRALDEVPGVRPVLGLFEGVCTGAADGWARMRGTPALALLHLGPGLANGLANLHNARRAATPVVTVVGDMATWHLPADAPLTTDISSLARPVSVWVRTAGKAGDLAADLTDAVAAARAGGPATLIVPMDAQWEAAGDGAPPPEAGPDAPGGTRPVLGVAEPQLEEAAAALRGPAPVLLLGGGALGERGLGAAGRIAAATGARLLCETFPARLERGGALPAPAKLPYLPEMATQALAGSALVLAGARAPVSFFGYPGLPSSTVPDGVPVHTLATPEQDPATALERLAEHLGAPAAPRGARPRPEPGDQDHSALTAASAGAVLAALQPEGAIVVDEAATSGGPYFDAAAAAPPHTFLSHIGGAIGMGLPVATGAAVACPDRPVIAFQADGSAMYTIQSLWTHAREGLDVTTLICANRGYAILQFELARAGAAQPGPAARALTDLGGPDLDFVALAQGMGVPGARATTPAELAGALRTALEEPGPHLIELTL